MNIMPMAILPHEQREYPGARGWIKSPHTGHRRTYSILSSVSQLRRFLAFCLAIDYRIAVRPSEYLTEVDYKYFLSLAEILFCKSERVIYRRSSITGISYKTTMTISRKHPILRGKYLVFAEEHNDWALEVEVSTLAPKFLDVVKHSGLPLAVVISMLRLFVSSLAQKTLEPRVRWLCKTHGVNTVREKLQFDRKLFPIIFSEDDQHARFQFEMAQVEYVSAWFCDMEEGRLTRRGSQQAVTDKMNERVWLVRVSCTVNKRTELVEEVGRAVKKEGLWPGVLRPIM